MDEAEHTLVGAGRDLRGPRRLERESHSCPASQQHRVTRMSVPFHDQIEPLVARVEVEVDRVAKPGPVDAEDAIARPEPGARRGALDADRADHDARELGDRRVSRSASLDSSDPHDPQPPITRELRGWPAD